MRFGIALAPEEFEAIEKLRVTTIADDIIVFGDGDTDQVALQDHGSKFLNLLEC